MYNITKILHIPVFFCDTLFTFTVRKSFIFKIIEFLILKTLTVTLIVFHYFFQNKLVDNQTTWYICCDIIYLTSIVEKKKKKSYHFFSCLSQSQAFVNVQLLDNKLCIFAQMCCDTAYPQWHTLPHSLHPRAHDHNKTVLQTILKLFRTTVRRWLGNLYLIQINK